jgi:peptide/nickel transport system substrate-binding protein
MVRILLPPAESPSLVPPQIRTIESGVDDPDQQFYENFVCGAVRNYTGYCNPEVDKLIDQQSAEANREKRKQLVWQIERKLAEEQARPIISIRAMGRARSPMSTDS